MRTKAISDLAQRSDRDLFREVATGLDFTARNACAIDDDAQRMWQEQRHRGQAILRAVAAEEAAKFLILLDAVRCPRRSQDLFSRQLRRFYEHLSKGIYVQYCNWQPATFADVETFIEPERAQFYLDGPNDVDWIFPNRVVNERESTLYVDFVETDEGHRWVEPPQYDVMRGFPYLAPGGLTLVRAFYNLGFADPGAVEVIAQVWRPVEMTPDFRRRDLRDLNRRTLERLHEKGLLRDAPDRALKTVIDGWLFPLHSVDLSLVEIDKDFLRAAQDDYLYREMGVENEPL